MLTTMVSAKYLSAESILKAESSESSGDDQRNEVAMQVDRMILQDKLILRPDKTDPMASVGYQSSNTLPMSSLPFMAFSPLLQYLIEVNLRYLRIKYLIGFLTFYYLLLNITVFVYLIVKIYKRCNYKDFKK